MAHGHPAHATVERRPSLILTAEVAEDHRRVPWIFCGPLRFTTTELTRNNRLTGIESLALSQQTEKLIPPRKYGPTKIRLNALCGFRHFT